MRTLTLRTVALAGVLTLAACSGGGGSEPPMPPPAAELAAALVSGLHFDYSLDRDGERPIAETGSEALTCPAGGCRADDLRELSGSDGTDTRGGFGTATGMTTAGPPLKETVSGATVTAAGAPSMRYGFWGEYGFAAVEIGGGTLSAEEAGGQQWSGRFRTAHAWAAGASPSGTNPAGTGSATWSGIAEAVRTADFAHLPGTAELRIADLSQPLVDADIGLDGLDGGAGVALEWRGMRLSGGSFGKGTAGTDGIEGRFHGPGHEEAWGAFDTGDHVGAFGARREP